LKRNLREDVVVYLETFAMLLQQELDKNTGEMISHALEIQETINSIEESVVYQPVNELVGA
jgi:hypothetical protein